MVAFHHIASSSKGVITQRLQNLMSLSDRTSREIPENTNSTLALSSLQDYSNQIEKAPEHAYRRNKNTSDIRRLS